MLESKQEKDSSKEESSKINRRTYLGAVAGSVFANTTTAAAQEADLSEVDWLEDGEKYTYNDASFEIEGVFVQDSVFYQSMPDAVRVRNGSGLQYLFVNLRFESTDTIRPPFSKFALIANDKRYECGNTVDNVPLFAITDAHREKMGETYHTEPMTPPESAVRVPPVTKTRRLRLGSFCQGISLPSSSDLEYFRTGKSKQHGN